MTGIVEMLLDSCFAGNGVGTLEVGVVGMAEGTCICSLSDLADVEKE